MKLKHILPIAVLSALSFLSPKEVQGQIVSKEVCSVFQNYALTSQKGGFKQLFSQIQYSSQQKQKILDALCSMAEANILVLNSSVLEEILTDKNIPPDMMPHFIMFILGVPGTHLDKNYHSLAEQYIYAWRDKSIYLHNNWDLYLAELDKKNAELDKKNAELDKKNAELDNGIKLIESLLGKRK